MRDEESFFGMAKKIQLREEERSMMREKLLTKVRAEGDVRLSMRMDERTFLASAKHIALSPGERATIKEALLSQISSSSHAWWLNPFKSLTSITAAFLIVTITGASVSYAAEDAMPGDVLYVVKTQVNEPLQKRMARSGLERTKVVARHTKRRLKEAEMLAKQSSLDMSTQRMLAESVRRGVREMEKEKTEIRHPKEMMEIGSLGMEMEASLHAHGELIGKLSDMHEQNESNELLSAIEETRMDIEEMTMTVSEEMPKESMENAIAIAETEIGELDKNMADDTSPRNTDSLALLERARTALSVSKDEPSLTEDERMTLTRVALRRAKEAEVLASLPEEAAVMDASVGAMEAVPAMMMKTANMDTAGADTAVALFATEPIAPMIDPPMEHDDLHFDAVVRLRMAEKKMKHLREHMEERREHLEEGMMLPMEVRMEGSEQLMNMAKMHMEEGQVFEALDASKRALEHAREATKEMEEMMPEAR